MKNGRIFDQIPPLIISGRSRICEHQRYCFSNIHSAAAANSDNRGRQSNKSVFDLPGQRIHICCFGFVIDVDPYQLIVFSYRHPVFQTAVLKYIIDQKNCKIIV